MSENISLSVHPELGSALQSHQGIIVIEGGHKNIFSTKPSNPNVLIIGVDPQIKKDRVIQKNVISIYDTLGGLYDQCANKADIVLMVAPSPLDIIKMIEEAEDLLKDGGQIIVILDRESNRKQHTHEALEEIKERYHGETEFKVRTVNVANEISLPNLLQNLTGLKIKPNSEISLSNSVVIVIKRTSITSNVLSGHTYS